MSLHDLLARFGCWLRKKHAWRFAGQGPDGTDRFMCCECNKMDYGKSYSDRTEY